jgi:hypothetical protein
MDMRRSPFYRIVDGASIYQGKRVPTIRMILEIGGSERNMARLGAALLNSGARLIESRIEGATYLPNRYGRAHCIVEMPFPCYSRFVGIVGLDAVVVQRQDELEAK